MQGHPIAGASWEGFVLEQIAAHMPSGSSLGFYRTAAGTELDVVVATGRRRIGFEIKFAAAPKVAKGFWLALQDLELDAAYVVAPVDRGYPLGRGAEVAGVHHIAELLARP